jgi:hypothetical protein
LESNIDMSLPARAPSSGSEGSDNWAPTSLPPAAAEVQAQLQALGAHFLFEKVGKGAAVTAPAAVVEKWATGKKSYNC